jgi:soluble cytochrome b562
MRVIGRSLSTSIDAITSATTAATAAKALETLQSALRTAADKIEATIPPEEIKTQHSRLVKAVRDFADGLSPIIAKVKAGTLTALSQVGRIKGYLEVQAASTAIAKKGYKIGG